MALRVLNIGFPKSGTTTLRKALIAAGFVTVQRHRPGEQPAGLLMLRAVRRGMDPMHAFRDVEAVTQLDSCRKGINVWPQMDMDFLRAVRDRYPKALFVLPTRDPAAILQSVKSQNDFRNRIGEAWGLFGTVTTDADLLAWVRWHYRVVRAQPWASGPHFLECRLDDPSFPRQLECKLGCSLPWWGRANASKRRIKR